MIKSMTLKEQKGITLIVLVVTIIVLLILAGISISMVLGDNGVLTNSEEAVIRTKIAGIDEQAKFISSIAALEQYQGKTFKESVKEGLKSYQNFKQEPEMRTDGKTATIEDIETGRKYEINSIYEVKYIEGINNKLLKIGDYVAYTPDTANEYEISSIDSGYASKYSVPQETLTWRVLDIKNEQIRLISTKQTDSQVYFTGYQGYNNGVYLLDELCSTLYSSSKGTARNIKIEDIQEKMNLDVWDYRNYTGPYKYGETREYTSENRRYYPSIFAQEKNQMVDSTIGTTYGQSEQTSLINQEGVLKAPSSIIASQGYWIKEMETSNFTDSIYFTLFIDNDSDFARYWISSRCVYPTANYLNFYMHHVSGKYVGGRAMYYSEGTSQASFNNILPIVTLNYDVQIDTSDVNKNGSSAEYAWELK